MCGRFTLQTTAEEAELFFDLTGVDARLLVPRYNISPTQPIVVIRNGEINREMVPMRWGLWPPWVKDPNDFPLLINARADGVATKNSFRNAFKRRRCLIPASGFYEWRAAGKGPKQPFWIAPASTQNVRLIAFAGLWETWCGADGSEVDTATIITTGANAKLAPIHHRMPALIEPGQFDAWLSLETPPDELMRMLEPPADDRLDAIPVSTRVNAARNEGPDLIEPVEIAAQESEAEVAEAGNDDGQDAEPDGQQNLF